MIEENPSFGYRTVVHLLGFNKNTVQRIFQVKGWQVRKRPVGLRPRIQALPSVAYAPDQRWATDLCRVWTGRDGWASLALVIDCYSPELLGLHLRSKTAESALEQALIARYGDLPPPSRTSLKLVKSVNQPENGGYEEEQIQRGTDHWVPSAGRGRHAYQGALPQWWLQ